MIPHCVTVTPLSGIVVLLKFQRKGKENVFLDCWGETTEERKFLRDTLQFVLRSLFCHCVSTSRGDFF